MHRMRLAALLLTGYTLTGCATPPPFRQPPDFSQRFERIETITLVPPKIAVYTMSAGNIEEEVQEWSDVAYEHVVVAVEAEVEELGRTFVPYTGPRSALPRFRVGDGEAFERAGGRTTPAEESWLLFEAVNQALLRHTYDPAQAFPGRIKDFDYTLGPEGAVLLGDTEADAFLLIIATDHVPTGGRQALVAAGLLAGAMTASYSGPGMTPAVVHLALIEGKTGDLIWFNRVSMPVSDLRDKATDAILVDLVMKGLER